MIPVCDLETLSPAGLVAGLQAASCIFVTGHGIPMDLIEAVHISAEAFFALPEAEKQKVAWSGRGAWQGWQRMAGDDDVAGGKPAYDLVERFELRLAQRTEADGPVDLSDAAAITRWGEAFALWPSRPAGFAELWTEYYAAMHDLCVRLIGLVADGLDMDRTTIDAWTTRQWSNLVVNHYPPQHRPPVAGRTRSRPHTDIGGFTILWSNDKTGGLEARTGDGGSWMPVDFPPGALLIQAGDLLTRWTNGRIPSNIHRVINPQPGSEAARLGRFSVVYFHHPDMDTTITDEHGHALLAAEHVRRRQRLDTPVSA